MPRKLRPRDVELLRIVGRFRMLTRAQVRRWLFSGLSDPIVTRCVDRLADRGYVGVERLNGNGIQVLWLTRKGEDFLVDEGVPASDLFAATGPAAAKDFQHTVAIGDVAAWLAQKVPPPEELLPAWAVQRILAGGSKLVPDIVAVWRHGVAAAAVMLIEVDLGTEPVKSVLGPKLRSLTVFAHDLFRGAELGIVLFVPSERRQESIRALLTEIGVVGDVRLLRECSGEKC